MWLFIPSLFVLVVVNVQRSSKLWCSTESFGSEGENGKDDKSEEEIGDILGVKEESKLQPQGVDPKRGWGFRGVHKVYMI